MDRAFFVPSFQEVSSWSLLTHLGWGAWFGDRR